MVSTKSIHSSKSTFGNERSERQVTEFKATSLLQIEGTEILI